MASAIIGGLLVENLPTLLFLPALYIAWFRVKEPREEPEVGLRGRAAAVTQETAADQPAARVRKSSALREIEAPSRFSSRWPIAAVPGIGSMAGERGPRHPTAVSITLASSPSAIRPTG